LELSFHDEDIEAPEPMERDSETSDESSAEDEDDGEEYDTLLPIEPDEDPGFDSAMSPTKIQRLSTYDPLRRNMPFTNFTREEVIAVFASLKIRHKVSDEVLLEIFRILNKMLDKFSNLTPLPTTRYAVSRLDSNYTSY
jgi:hypothetical protein